MLSEKDIRLISRIFSVGFIAVFITVLIILIYEIQKHTPKYIHCQWKEYDCSLLHADIGVSDLSCLKDNIFRYNVRIGSRFKEVYDTNTKTCYFANIENDILKFGKYEISLTTGALKYDSELCGSCELLKNKKKINVK